MRRQIACTQLGLLSVILSGPLEPSIALEGTAIRRNQEELRSILRQLGDVKQTSMIPPILCLDIRTD